MFSKFKRVKHFVITNVSLEKIFCIKLYNNYTTTSKTVV